MKNPLENQIGPLRKEIDALDGEILSLINRRARLAMEIGTAKQLHQAPVYHPGREAAVLEKLCAANQGPLKQEAVSTIFREIMSGCRSLESPLTVAFLGPTGTYSELALLQRFGHMTVRQSCATIDDVFRAVEASAAEFGVVPVENSSEGAVGRTMDLLLHTPLLICGEVALKVEHHLLTQAASIAEIKTIEGHSQALAQCGQWLNGHAATIPQIAVASNGLAAQHAATDRTVAAIAGERAASVHGLSSLARNIQDDPSNTTRFLLIGTHKSDPTGRDRTSLVVSVPNRPGAVYHMLQPFATHGVSMTRLESRPARSGMWSYLFYIDLEGHLEDPALGKALAELKVLADFVRIFGSYPIH